MIKKTICLCITSWCVSLPPVVNAQSQQATEPDLSLMNEQIQIMRLVVANALNEALRDLYREEIAVSKTEQQGSTGVTTQLEPRTEDGQALIATLNQLSSSYSLGFGTQQFTSNTRGFYLPGYGVVINTEVAIPMQECDSGAKPGSRRSAWEVAKRELHGEQAPELNSDDVTMWVLNSTFIDRATDVVLECVADYGLNIDQLSEGETIAVALKFVASTSSGLAYRLPNKSAASHLWYNAYVSGAAASGAHNVIIQIPKERLRAWSDQGPRDTAALRRGAHIVSYGDVVHSAVKATSRGVR